MSLESYRIRPFDPSDAGGDEFQALHLFSSLMRQEYWPEDPPPALDETIGRWRAVPGFVDRKAWAVWEVEHLVALAVVSIADTDDNRHLADANIEVLPKWRRQGIATQLLDRVVTVAEENDRRLLIGNTDSLIPAGDAFTTALGASLGLTNSISQLDLTLLDRKLVRQWQESGQRQAGDEFELVIWKGSYPEEYLDAIVELLGVMNTAPRGSLDIEDAIWTHEQLRQWDEAIAARGTEKWTTAVLHRKSGKFAGYTEVFCNRHQQEILGQGMTGIFPEFRNRGLGRWVKAAMLEQIVRERPCIRWVRTGNATVNASMLNINHELGFRHYKEQAIWQVDTKLARDYLHAQQQSKTESK